MRRLYPLNIILFSIFIVSCAQPATQNIISPISYTFPAGVVAPDALAIDVSGNIWVLGQAGDVAEINPAGTIITTYSLPSGNGGLTSYAGIAIAASGNIWAVNYAGGFVARLVPYTNTVQTYSTGFGPYGVAIDNSGNIWVGDTGTGSTPYSSITELVGSNLYYSSYGNTVSQDCVESVAIDGLGYTWLSGCGSVYILDTSAKVTGSYTFSSGGPGNIAIDQNENAWVVDTNALYLLSPPNNPVLMYADNRSIFQGIAIDRAGNVWVTDAANANLFEFNPSGTTLNIFSTGNNPGGVAIDVYGNVWVANTNDNTITEWVNVAMGPQYFPYTGPQFPGGQP